MKLYELHKIHSTTTDSTQLNSIQRWQTDTVDNQMPSQSAIVRVSLRQLKWVGLRFRKWVNPPRGVTVALSCVTKHRIELSLVKYQSSVLSNLFSHTWLSWARSGQTDSNYCGVVKQPVVELSRAGLRLKVKFTFGYPFVPDRHQRFCSSSVHRWTSWAKKIHFRHQGRCVRVSRIKVVADAVDGAQFSGNNRSW